jgi:hypothetical protein
LVIFADLFAVLLASVGCVGLGAIPVNKIEIVFVQIGVKATQRQDFGHSSLTRPAFNVNDYVQRPGSVCFDRHIRDFNPALRHASSES